MSRGRQDSGLRREFSHSVSLGGGALTVQLPQYPCIAAAVTQIGCEVDNYTCMCSKFNDLQLAAAGCVYTNCGLEGVSAVLAAAQAVCAACA